MGLGGLEVLGFYSLGQRLGFRVGVGLGFRDRVPVDEAKGYRFHRSGRKFVRFFRLQVEPVFPGNKYMISFPENLPMGCHVFRVSVRGFGVRGPRLQRFRVKVWGL